VALIEDPKARFPRLLICEGHEDKLFFHHLITVRRLPQFHIMKCSGNGGFAEAIRAFRIDRTKQFNALRDILIVADNDETPRDNFMRVCSQIEQVFGPGTSPPDPMAKAKTTPAVTVMMIPWIEIKGHLERLCVDAAHNADRKIGGHVQTFMSMINADKWGNESRYGKAWLRTNLAARCERDPFVPLGKVFSDSDNWHLIPMVHPSFNQIANALSSFGP
jgi:hypothetical protein